MSERKRNGRASIRIDDELVMLDAPIKIEHPKAGEIQWGMMEVKELFDTFQSFLLLPEGYSIIGVFYEPLFQAWNVIVESKSILLPSPGEMIPLLIPTYERTADGKTRLVDIGLPKRWHYYAGNET